LTPFTMKKILFIAIALCTLGVATSQVALKNKTYRNKNKDRFSVKDITVYYDGKPLAKYQAKTYSLDNDELTEEYNLLIIDNKIENKQLIGDLIDFISERHKGAEVEVEINAEGSDFKL
ncbi:MAG: hypothetical protein ACK420_01095, partial [Sphingomonadales bacterium]